MKKPLIIIKPRTTPTTAKERRHERRKQLAIQHENERQLEIKITCSLMQCSEKTAKALSLPSFRERQLETIKLPRRKQFGNFNAWGKQKIRSGEKPLIWG